MNRYNYPMRKVVELLVHHQSFTWLPTNQTHLMQSTLSLFSTTIRVSASIHDAYPKHFVFSWFIPNKETFELHQMGSRRKVCKKTTQWTHLMTLCDKFSGSPETQKFVPSNCRNRSFFNPWLTLFPNKIVQVSDTPCLQIRRYRSSWWFNLHAEKAGRYTSLAAWPVGNVITKNVRWQ